MIEHCGKQESSAAGKPVFVNRDLDADASGEAHALLRDKAGEMRPAVNLKDAVDHILGVGRAPHIIEAQKLLQTQDAILKNMSAAKIPMSLSSDQFFAMFFANVKEGLFADPIYGGNYNMIGWKWVRFPGNPMAYGDPYATYIDQFNYPYNVAPKGLADQVY